MNSDWETVRLGEICTLTKGKSPTLKTPPGDYPLVVTGPEPLSSEGFQFEGEAVCIPMVSSTGHGHASLKRVHYASGRFAVANIITAAEVNDPAKCDTRFLYYYLQHFKDDLIVTRMQGTANVSLSQKVLATVPVQLPPLDEQRRMVDLISSLDDAIEASHVAINQLVSVQSATLASQILREGDPMSTLESVFEHVIGGSWGSPVGEEDKEVSAIGSSAYAAGRIDVDPRLGTPRSLSEKRAYVRELKPGDIVLERSGGSPTQPVGRVLRMNSDIRGIVPSDFMRLLRVDASIVEPSFVFWFLWSLYKTGASEPFQKYTTGIRNLNIPDYLHSTTIHIPEDPAERARIIDLAESMAATVSMAKEEAGCLHALRAELLSALLSGAHTIPELYDELMGDRAL